MARAKDSPVSTGSNELSPEHFPAPQFPAVNLATLIDSPAEPIVTEVEGIATMSEADAKNAYLAELKFNEDGVTVIIPPGHGKDAPKYVYCAVQGVGAEVYNPKTKTWMRFPYLPVNTQMVVKRKYLEVLARSRIDTVETREVTTTPRPNQDGFEMVRETQQAAPFYVRFDPAGERGADWYRRVMSDF